MPEVVVRLGSAEDASVHFDEICTLYDTVFSQPPFRWADAESGHHRELLTSLMQEPSFGIALAELSDELIGFAYGYTVPVDTKRWQDFLAPLPEDVTHEEPGRTFALIDLAVGDEWRGQGLGRSLIETLLASRSERRATLTVQPAAQDTQDFYAHLGWHKVGRKRMPPGVVSPLFDVYLLELPARKP